MALPTPLVLLALVGAALVVASSKKKTKDPKRPVVTGTVFAVDEVPVAEGISTGGITFTPPLVELPTPEARIPVLLEKCIFANMIAPRSVQTMKRFGIGHQRVMRYVARMGAAEEAAQEGNEEQLWNLIWRALADGYDTAPGPLHEAVLHHPQRLFGLYELVVDVIVREWNHSADKRERAADLFELATDSCYEAHGCNSLVRSAADFCESLNPPKPETGKVPYLLKGAASFGGTAEAAFAPAKGTPFTEQQCAQALIWNSMVYFEKNAYPIDEPVVGSGPEVKAAIQGARLSAAKSLGAELIVVSCDEPCVRIGTKPNPKGGDRLEVVGKAHWLWASFPNGYNVLLDSVTDMYGGGRNGKITVADPRAMIDQPLNTVLSWRNAMEEMGTSLPWSTSEPPPPPTPPHLV